MSETTTAVANTASKKASQAAAAVSEALPTVVETVEMAVEVPAKVIVNQRLVVAAAVVGGAAVGAGILFGTQKFIQRRRVTKLHKLVEDVQTHNDENPSEA